MAIRLLRQNWATVEHGWGQGNLSLRVGIERLFGVEGVMGKLGLGFNAGEGVWIFRLKDFLDFSDCGENRPSPSWHVVGNKR